MTDHPEGPGWWVASDGKWYPPETHPNYQPLPPPPPTTRGPTASGIGTPRLAAIIGSGAVLLGCFLPWAKVAFITIDGTDADDFPVFLALGLGALVASLAAKALPVLLLGIVTGVLWTIEYADITDRGNETGIDVSVGAGLWLILAGAVTCTISGFMIRSRSRG